MATPNERIKLRDSGWVVEISKNEDTDDSYTIEKIFAVFGHEQYFPIDTSEFTDEQWDMFHERVLEEMRRK